MKTKLLLPILLLIAILVSTSIQQVQKPNCYPVSSTKTYKDTLFVFLVESHGTTDGGTIRYIMKQLACTIPKASNVETFILEYTDQNAAIQANFYDSDGMIGKIPASMIGAVSPATTKCTRMTKVQQSFSQLPAVQSKNVKYIALYATGVCSQPSGVTDWVQIDLKLGQGNQRWFMLTDFQGGLFDFDEDNASQFLLEKSKEIIGKALGDNSMVPADAQAISNNENPMKFNTLAIIVTIIAVILGIVVLVLVRVIFVIYKKGNKGSDGTKHKKKKNKNGNEPSSSDANTTGTPDSKDNSNNKKELEGVHLLTSKEENGLVERSGYNSIVS